MAISEKKRASDKRYAQSEKGRAFQRKTNHRPEAKAARKRYRASPEGRANMAKHTAAWRERNAEKRKSQYTLYNAVKRGEVMKIDHCEHCGESPTEGHHPSYAEDMRLVVTWLCNKCHNAAHGRVSP